MILSQIVIEKFKSLIGAMEPWKSLKGSQFVQHLAIMLGWSIEDASYKVERAHQEGFLDTAINRSSILAHGEDREYIPRKPTPGRGKANIINQGGFSITLLRGMEFMSDGQNQYCLNETTIIPAYSTVEAAFTQSWKEEITHEITEEKPFYEILFGRDISPTVMDFSVHVDESGRGEFELWVYNRRFFNVGADASCYDEFYHYTDQIGIRFGNGIFGRIPPKGAIVKITMTRTLGDVFLLSGQTLYPIEELTYPNGEPASISIEVSETIQDGSDMEPTEEMRRNLHYWPVYDERLIWDNDYEFFLKRRFPEVVFVKAWGEEEAEKMWGYNVEHINKIWIAAYAPRTGIKEDVMKAISDVPMMCRNFKWHDVEHISFSVKIVGKVLSDRIIEDVKNDILKTLQDAYGRDSTNRRDSVRLHEIYECIYGTGHFDKTTGAWFEATIEGQHQAEFIYQMVSIDIKASAPDITYVQ